MSPKSLSNKTENDTLIKPATTAHVPAPETNSDELVQLLQQYGCGPIQFTGTDGLYERHLVFDNAKDQTATDSREHFEAVARSIRDVLSQRWMATEKTHKGANPKRIYYLSMEFLIGRSLANNVTNLVLGPLASQFAARKNLDWLELIEQEPDAGLGNGGLGRLAACFLDSMATMELPAMGYGLRYEYGIFKQFIRDGWQQEKPDNWLRRPDPWEVARPGRQVNVNLNCSFKMDAGELRAVPGQPSTLIGLPYDRPVVGYGGKTINTLRLWEATSSDYFDFQKFSSGDFVGALADMLSAESLTRVLYPDDSTSRGKALRFVQEYFLVACSLADLVRRFRATNSDWSALPDRVAIDAPATPQQKASLAMLSPEAVKESKLAGDPIIGKLTRAPGNNAPIGGLKVATANGWFAARPSGTESIYKIYAESFRDERHLGTIVNEAQEIVNNALAGSGAI